MSSAGFAHHSIADIAEDKLVETVLADPLWSREFFELYGMPSRMQNKQRVPLHRAPGKCKGDVDALLCLPEFPGQSVAFEIKRIKFGIPALRPGGRPNKLHEFEKAAQQANLLARIGFWQVYLYVVVVADAREQNAGKNTYAGLSSKLKSLVYSTVSTSPLDERVGLAIMEFTQTADSTPFTVGTHGLHLLRKSGPIRQSLELTEWVRQVFGDRP
jgi:hypothetical protein